MTHRDCKDLTIIFIASLHHFIGILEEFANDANQRQGDRLTLRHERWRAFASASWAKGKEPECNQSQSKIKVPHGDRSMDTASERTECVMRHDAELRSCCIGGRTSARFVSVFFSSAWSSSNRCVGSYNK